MNFGDFRRDFGQLSGVWERVVEKHGLEKNTLILFTGDNGTSNTLSSPFGTSIHPTQTNPGPWMVKNASAGSTGLFTGRSSGYVFATPLNL